MNGRNKTVNSFCSCKIDTFPCKGYGKYIYSDSDSEITISPEANFAETANAFFFFFQSEYKRVLVLTRRTAGSSRVIFLLIHENWLTPSFNN